MQEHEGKGTKKANRNNFKQMSITEWSNHEKER